MGYVQPLGKATPRKPRKMRISGWAFMTDAKLRPSWPCRLPTPIPASRVLSGDLDFGTEVKTPGKWVEVSKDITDARQCQQR